MKYDLKTGRLNFEVADSMTCKIKTPNKREKTAVIDLEVNRPKTKVKTYSHLEKKLSEFAMSFSRTNGRFIIRRIICAAEKFAFARKVATYSIASVITAVLIFGSVSAVDLRLASEAIIDGHPIGVIADKKAFEALLVDVHNSLEATMGKQVDGFKKPVYISRLIFKKDLSSDYKLRQNLLSTFDEVLQAYAIYTGDRLICATFEEKLALDALSRVKAQYAKDGVQMSVEFVEPVTVRKEFVPIGYIRSADGVFSSLTESSEESQKYTIKHKDTLWSIAAAFDMSVDDIMAINDNLTDIIHDGDEIFIKKNKPLLSVRTSYISSSEEPIPFDNEEIKDNNLLAGNTQVVKQGIDGKKHIVEEIVSINGDEVERNVKSEEIISNPIGGVVKIGAKAPPTGIASGKLIRPAYGTITSRYGRRSRGFHTGIDYASPVGTPIKAADNGTVAFAGRSGGYGNLIKITHGNGTETYYAHCSAILVKNGQKVSKGQQIGRVGNTGNSTGPHLHFEVRKNGAPQNPQAYVN